MTDEVLLRHGTTMVGRLVLEPGETMPWQRDPFHRVAVVLGGDLPTFLAPHNSPHTLRPPSDDRDWGEAHSSDAFLRRSLLPPFSDPAFPSAFPPVPPALLSYPAAPAPRLRTLRRQFTILSRVVMLLQGRSP